VLTYDKKQDQLGLLLCKQNIFHNSQPSPAKFSSTCIDPLKMHKKLDIEVLMDLGLLAVN